MNDSSWSFKALPPNSDSSVQLASTQWSSFPAVKQACFLIRFVKESELLASDGLGDELETAEPLHGALSSWETAYKRKLPVTLMGIPEATI